MSEEVKDGDVNHEGDDEPELEVIEQERTFKDVILGNQLPPQLLAVAIIAFIVSFECFVIISGIFIKKYYSICFAVPFLLVPLFWGCIFFLSKSSLKTIVSLQRTLQSLMLGYFADTIVYLGQWIAVYGMLIIINQIYNFLDNNATILFISTVWETLFEAILLEAIPEEILKFAIVWHISTLETLPSKYSVVVYAIFSSLGFIFFSGTLRILRVYWMSGVEQATVYFFIESLLTSTMQIVTSLWIALNFIKQNFRHPDKDHFPTWRVVLPSIVFHALFMSLISVMYNLYYWGDLDWKLFALICILAFIFLMVALFLSFRRVKKLFSDPDFYALLVDSSFDDSVVGDDDDMYELDDI